jgi:hypothetical protein
MAPQPGLEVAVDDCTNFQTTLVLAQETKVESPAPCGIALCSLNTKKARSVQVPLKRVLCAEKTTLSVGREERSEPSIAIADPRVSGRHFIVHVNIEYIGARTSTPATDVSETADDAEVAPVVQCILTDLSTNGTYVNRRKVGRGKQVVLRSGDEVSVLIVENVGADDAVSFVFRSGLDDWARQMREFSDPRTCSSEDPETNFRPLRPRSLPPLEKEGPATKLLSPVGKSQDSVPGEHEQFGRLLEDELTCPCCCGVFFRCTACLPCLHNFCAPCVSEWVRDRGECPVCREPVSELVRNCAIDGVVESLYMAFPERRRSKCEMEDLQARADMIPDMSIRLSAGTKPIERSKACVVM